MTEWLSNCSTPRVASLTCAELRYTCVNSPSSNREMPPCGPLVNLSSPSSNREMPTSIARQPLARGMAVDAAWTVWAKWLQCWITLNADCVQTSEHSCCGDGWCRDSARVLTNCLMRLENWRFGSAAVHANFMLNRDLNSISSWTVASFTSHCELVPFIWLPLMV